MEPSRRSSLFPVAPGLRGGARALSCGNRTILSTRSAVAVITASLVRVQWYLTVARFAFPC